MTEANSEPTLPGGVAKGFLRDNLEVVCFAILIIMFFKTFVGQQFTIPSASMRNTLMIGDHLLVNKFIFAVPQWSWEEKLFPMRSVERGDIIVFRYPLDRDHGLREALRGPARGHRGDAQQAPLPERQAVHRPLGAPRPEPQDGPHARALAPHPRRGPPGAAPRKTCPWPGPSPTRTSWPWTCRATTCSKAGSGTTWAPSPCRPGGCSPWATTGTIPPTAATGASCPSTTCAAGPSSSGGATGKAATTTPTPRVPEGPRDVLANFADGARHFFTRTRWERTGAIPR